MGKINKETTKRNSLYKRERNLDKSTNNLNIIRMILEDLEKLEIRCTPIEQLYKREWKRNERLAKLVEEQNKKGEYLMLKKDAKRSLCQKKQKRECLRLTKVWVGV